MGYRARLQVHDALRDRSALQHHLGETASIHATLRNCGEPPDGIGRLDAGDDIPKVLQCYREEESGTGAVLGLVYESEWNGLH